MTEIHDVLIFPNGMVAVFDRDGDQIPEFQGAIDDVATNIVDACRGQANFERIRAQIANALISHKVANG